MPVLRFPTKIISYVERLYFAFALNYKDVQMLLYRGIDLCHEAIRDRSQKKGQHYGNPLRCRRP